MPDLENERRALALFEAMLEIDEEERQAWLENETAGDFALKQRVTAFIEAERQLSLKTGAYVDAIETVPPPERIGAYRITGTIGSGGMGTVFSAERDEGDFDHSVAIKLIKPGIFTDLLVTRFNRERQILAGLSHPNIARLFDGGTTENGQPYIVMERIDGVPLLDWLAAAKPDLATRLRLFLQVCSAAGHAHRNLVVHRDLTPANVLVGRDGDAKLIDFGIARPEGEGRMPGAEEGDNAPPVRAVTMTPGYAAPERVAGDAATVLSDIYSAGKMLEALLPADASEELQAIVAKATADDPDDRYLSTDTLAEDVDAVLEDRPVSAMPDTPLYRAGKFYRRNRLPVSVGLVGIAALVGALILAATAYFRAENARAAEGQRVEQLRALANYMLFDHNGELATVIGNGEARAELVDRAQSYLLTLSELSDEDPSLRLDTALGFIELARIQGVSAQPNFGDHDLALGNLDRAAALLERTGTLGPRTNAASGRLEAYRALILMHAKSQPDEAEAAIARGMNALDAVPKRDRGPDWAIARSDLRRAQLESTDLALDSPRMAEFVTLFRSELAEWPDVLKDTPRHAVDLALAQYYYANHFAFGDDADPKRSLDEFQVSTRQFADFLEQNPNDPFALYFQAWNAYYGHGSAIQIEDFRAADELLGQAEQSTAQLRRIEEKDESLEKFAELLIEARANLDALMGNFDRAIAGQRAIVEARIAAVAASDNASSHMSDLAYGHMVLGDMALRARRRNLACESYSEAARLMLEVAERGDLRGYVEAMRERAEANRDQCANGAPVTALRDSG
ncbi:MAG: serine/threonine-protein kinase [Erythrobacter sp.]|nr:serine/threonine-protein kinase [Erythrobacter sp.]